MLRDIWLFLFPLTGIGLVVIPGGLLLQEKYPELISVELNFDKLTVYGVSGVMLCVGLYILVVPLVIQKNYFKRCTVKVMGLCIGVESHRRSTRRTGVSYAPVWEYEWEGKKYTVEGPNLKNKKENIPKTGLLYLNPQDPSDCFEPRTTQNLMGYFITGTIFIFSSVIPFIVGFMGLL